jgi:hypothetical protein
MTASLAESRVSFHRVGNRIDAVYFGLRPADLILLGRRGVHWWCSCPLSEGCSHLKALKRALNTYERPSDSA